MTAILAREEHLPAGQKAIEWRLLTNRTAETLEAVVELIDGYRRRWLITFGASFIHRLNSAMDKGTKPF